MSTLSLNRCGDCERIAVTASKFVRPPKQWAAPTDRVLKSWVDLRDAAAYGNRSDEFFELLQALGDLHANKPSLVCWLRDAGLDG